MKTLASFLAISALVVAAVSTVQAEGEPTLETLFDISHRLLGIPVLEGEKLNEHDYDATRQALSALLAVSNAMIPASSSCYSVFYEGKEYTVKDMLLLDLALMSPGGNYMLQGNCQSGQCAVYFNRQAGEAVSTTIITFDLVQGEASVPTLQCLVIP
ncbi:MAG: hypothetical protein FWH15_09785 [Betaproteobacteria bacterium]|nr:hypothetical protein [Betaproteobacteria bacterium]